MGGLPLLLGNKREDDRTQAAQRAIQVGHYEEFLHGMGCETLEWIVQGGGGVTTPGGVQDMTRGSS